MSKMVGNCPKLCKCCTQHASKFGKLSSGHRTGKGQLSFQSQRKVKVKSLSHVRPSETPWTVAYQAPLSMGFPRQEYWSGLPFPPPGYLPDPGIEPMSPAMAGRFFTIELPRKPIIFEDSILISQRPHLLLLSHWGLGF